VVVPQIIEEATQQAVALKAKSTSSFLKENLYKIKFNIQSEISDKQPFIVHKMHVNIYLCKMHLASVHTYHHYKQELHKLLEEMLQSMQKQFVSYTRQMDPILVERPWFVPPYFRVFHITSARL
jgi:hypothetical protein